MCACSADLDGEIVATDTAMSAEVVSVKVAIVGEIGMTYEVDISDDFGIADSVCIVAAA